MTVFTSLRLELAALSAALALGGLALQDRAQAAARLLPEDPGCLSFAATEAPLRLAEAAKAEAPAEETSSEAVEAEEAAAEKAPEAEESGENRSFTLVIHHTELEKVEIDPRVGDELVIRNTGDIAHNLYLTYEDGTVETLHTQPPGTEKRTTFKASGRVLVRCWIHPIIRLELDVTAAA